MGPRERAARCPAALPHCRGIDGGDWAPIAERPAAASRPRRVYAPDLRGHGRGTWLGDEPDAYVYESPCAYACEVLRDDIRAFLAALGIDRADLVGHSLGGAVACLLAQQAPALARRLVLEDVPAPIPLDPPRPPLERPAVDLPFDGAMVWADEQRNAPDPAWWEGMRRIRVPTLLVAGGPGSVIPQEQVTLLAGRIPGARVTTVDAGHLVHETRPTEFLAVVEPFLAP